MGTTTQIGLSQCSLPALFLERFQRVLGDSLYASHGIQSFEYGKVVSVRINTLKISITEIEEIFKDRGVLFREVTWCPEALILEDMTNGSLGVAEFFEKGFLYAQGLSSLLPVLVLDPKPGERVLDMCAAPGSKTTQMAASLNKEGEVVAIENIRGRFYKLKSVLSLLGAQNVQVKMLDARRYRDEKGFDKILVDAPCSSEGRFKISDPKSYAYWSLRKVKEMAHKQRGLVLAASRLLKPGGVLVYSTCTFAPEENEGVIDWLLKKTDGTLKVEPIFLEDMETYPAVIEWERKIFNSAVKNGLRVLPTKDMEGFFMAKLLKA